MRRRIGALHRSRLAVAWLLAVAACAPANEFILLPNEDGSIGSIVVSNAAGAQRIDAPLQATVVDRADRSPAPAEARESDAVRRRYGAAIAAAAPRPRTYMVSFVTGTDQVTRESEAQFPTIIAALRDFPAPEVCVIGHTDTVGSAASNARLALQRANTIRDRLVAAGLDPRVIEVSSHGEGNPLVPTADEVDEPRNRRVEVTIR
jgi:outer membrane protein OmpA-like peptidoglycan-associated protein